MDILMYVKHIESNLGLQIARQVLAFTITIIITSQSQASVFFIYWHCLFQVRTDDPDLPEQCQARRYYQAVTYSSPSQNFLSLSWTSSYRSLLVGEHLSITVTPESPYVDKIKHYSYLVSSIISYLHPVSYLQHSLYLQIQFLK